MRRTLPILDKTKFTDILYS